MLPSLHGWLNYWCAFLSHVIVCSLGTDCAIMRAQSRQKKVWTYWLPRKCHEIHEIMWKCPYEHVKRVILQKGTHDQHICTTCAWTWFTSSVPWPSMTDVFARLCVCPVGWASASAKVTGEGVATSKHRLLALPCCQGIDPTNDVRSDACAMAWGEGNRASNQRFPLASAWKNHARTSPWTPEDFASFAEGHHCRMIADWLQPDPIVKRPFVATRFPRDRLKVRNLSIAFVVFDRQEWSQSVMIVDFYVRIRFF